MSTTIRWTIYILLILTSLIGMEARILYVGKVPDRFENWLELYQTGETDFRFKGTPFHSANDRSRWATIRSLGDENTYRIDNVIFNEKGRNTRWHTIDLVRHRGRDGKLHYYSSKPTLLPTMMTYTYIGVRSVTGWKLSEDEDVFKIAWCLLNVFNVIPLLIICFLTAKAVERYAESDFTRIFIVACACFGTFLTTFAITLNNHVPAAFGVMLATYPLMRIWLDDDAGFWHFLCVGLGASFAAANELPALSFMCVAIFGALIKSPGRTILVSIPAAAIVIAAFFGTNLIAHNEWKPAYTHRSDGDVLAQLPADLIDEKEIDSQIGSLSKKPQFISLPKNIRASINEYSEALGFELSSQTKMIVGQTPVKSHVEKRYVVFDPVTDQQVALVKKVDNDHFDMHRWNHWYEYPRSYWLLGNKQGVDKGESSQFRYAFHVFVGHHGIFSLTPIWVIAFAGMGYGLFAREQSLRWIMFATVVLSAVCIGFYLARPLEDRNYGGVTSALRWLFWLSPMWLVAMIPWLDRTESKGLKFFFVVLLLLSFVSASYSCMNPWQHPWIYEWFDNMGWINAST